MANLFKRCSANKLLSGKDTSPCWYCEMPTQYAMTEKDGSEIWCCEHCLVKHGKIKRFKKRLKKYSTLPKKSKIKSVLHVKNQESSVICGGLKDE